MHHGKSKGGRFFAAFFRNLGGDKISLLFVALISSAN